jgi:hypothetical protein
MTSSSRDTALHAIDSHESRAKDLLPNAPLCKMMQHLLGFLHAFKQSFPCYLYHPARFGPYRCSTARFGMARCDPTSLGPVSIGSARCGPSRYGPTG